MSVRTENPVHLPRSTILSAQNVIIITIIVVVVVVVVADSTQTCATATERGQTFHIYFNRCYFFFFSFVSSCAQHCRRVHSLLLPGRRVGCRLFHFMVFHLAPLVFYIYL